VVDGASAKVDLTEALGSEIVVHFCVAAPKVVTGDTKELMRDAHTEDVPTAQNGTPFVASFTPLPGCAPATSCRSSSTGNASTTSTRTRG
jgi:hypothetical protein